MGASDHDPRPWAETFHSGIDCRCGWTSGLRRLDSGQQIPPGSRFAVSLPDAWKLYRQHFADATSGTSAPVLLAPAPAVEHVRLFDPDLAF